MMPSDAPRALPPALLAWLADTRARSLALNVRAVTARAESVHLRDTVAIARLRRGPGGAPGVLAAAFASLESAARSADDACARARDATEFEAAFLNAVAGAIERLPADDRAALSAGLGALAAALGVPPHRPRPARFRPPLRR